MGYPHNLGDAVPSPLPMEVGNEKHIEWLMINRCMFSSTDYLINDLKFQTVTRNSRKVIKIVNTTNINSLLQPPSCRSAKIPLGRSAPLPLSMQCQIKYCTRYSTYRSNQKRTMRCLVFFAAARGASSILLGNKAIRAPCKVPHL